MKNCVCVITLVIPNEEDKEDWFKSYVDINHYVDVNIYLQAVCIVYQTYNGDGFVFLCGINCLGPKEESIMS